jgi:hypothetical protein
MSEPLLARARRDLEAHARAEGARTLNEQIARKSTPLPAIDGPAEELAWLTAFYERFEDSESHRSPRGQEYLDLKALPARIVPRAAVYDPLALAPVVELAASSSHSLQHGVLLGAVERSVAQHGLPPLLRLALGTLRARRVALPGTKSVREEVARMDALLAPSAVRQGPTEGEPWADRARAELAPLDEETRGAWSALFAFLLEQTGSRPSARWKKTAATHVARLGEATFTRYVLGWFALVDKATQLDSLMATRGQLCAPLMNETNAALLRGLVWSCAGIDDAEVAVALGDLATACFAKVPNIGAISPLVGNACIYALETCPGLAGVAQLGRLRTRVPYAVANRLIEKALAATAERTGHGREDLEDLAVPTFAEVPVDEAARRKQRKDRATMLAAQRIRLESLLGGERRWSLADARLRLLDHPLLASLTRSLVWTVHRDSANGGDVLALPTDGAFADLRGAPLGEIPGATKVSLWHPLGTAAEIVAAWRARLAALEVTQPFKQAHREIYLLTDAERATVDASARFSGHLLKQHQLASLAAARGWRYSLQGAHFDSSNDPRRAPPGGLVAVLELAPIEEPVPESTSGIALHVTTARVVFHREGGGPRVPLADIPPLVFSEVMRDIDLFVGVCSVGNDPRWLDTENDQARRDYWRGFAFGPLRPAARIRRETLAALLPRLRIADRCELEDRFLRVRGDLRTYRIHLGSSNVLMEPNDQYLCVVPARKATDPTEKLPLPYEGDAGLSVILSKALLLAADRKIQDPSITGQIGEGASSPPLR